MKYEVNSVSFPAYGDERDQDMIVTQFERIPANASDVDAGFLGLERRSPATIRECFGKLSKGVTTLRLMGDGLPDAPEVMQAILSSLHPELTTLYLEEDFFGLPSIVGFQSFPPHIRHFHVSFYVLNDDSIAALANMLDDVTMQLDTLSFKKHHPTINFNTLNTHPGEQPSLFDLSLADFQRLFGAISPLVKQVILDTIAINSRTNVSDLCDKIACLPRGVGAVTFKSSDPSTVPFTVSTGLPRAEIETILNGFLVPYKMCAETGVPTWQKTIDGTYVLSSATEQTFSGARPAIEPLVAPTSAVVARAPVVAQAPAAVAQVSIAAPTSATLFRAQATTPTASVSIATPAFENVVRVPVAAQVPAAVAPISIFVQAPASAVPVVAQAPVAVAPAAIANPAQEEIDSSVRATRGATCSLQ